MSMYPQSIVLPASITAIRFRNAMLRLTSEILARALHGMGEAMEVQP